MITEFLYEKQKIRTKKVAGRIMIDFITIFNLKLEITI